MSRRNARQEAIEEQLRTMGFRMEPSLAALEGDEGHALIDIATGENVDPPDELVLRLAEEWCSLEETVAAVLRPEGIAGQLEERRPRTVTFHVSSPAGRGTNEAVRADIQLGNLSGGVRDYHVGVVRESLRQAFSALWCAAADVVTTQELQAQREARPWRDGEVAKFGPKGERDVTVFAGMFRISGFGMGHYYSASRTVEWLDLAAATKRAHDEGVGLVAWPADQVRSPLDDFDEDGLGYETAAEEPNDADTARSPTRRSFLFTMGTGDLWTCCRPDGLGMEIRPIAGGEAWRWMALRSWWNACGDGQAPTREAAVTAAAKVLADHGLDIETLPLGDGPRTVVLSSKALEWWEGQQKAWNAVSTVLEEVCGPEALAAGPEGAARTVRMLAAAAGAAQAACRGIAKAAAEPASPGQQGCGSRAPGKACAPSDDAEAMEPTPAGIVLVFPGASEREAQELVEAMTSAGTRVHRVHGDAALQALREGWDGPRNVDQAPEL